MRRHDLDWIRVIVFGLLILYHVGMFFVPWDWHIKSETSIGWLRYPMLFINQWRLPILFVVSGMGTYYAFNKRNGRQFILERSKRLLIPLLVGILIIVPPQVYLERLVQHQFQGNYFEFWPAHAFTGVYPSGNFSWHHLWFLPYLFTFSLLLYPLFIYLKKWPGNRLGTWIKEIIINPAGFLWFAIPLYLAEALLEPFFPVTHALAGDWFTLTSNGFLFFYGFLLISVKEVFWPTVQKFRKRFLFCGIIGFSIWLFTILSFQDTIYLHFSEAFLKVFNLGSWILAIFGYAAHYLNKPSYSLSYANEAVYPFYILHQTVTILLGYLILRWDWPSLPAFLFLTLGTFGFTWLMYAILIRPWKWIRPLFGLKSKKYKNLSASVPQQPAPIK
ncbi:acyltransferase family protein [Zeaxanthinibacter sp. PT1]|uniref:acyltransferase family protein n=1 Tax=Zeaxanthinibacter TaxID=561554 RepID=UPI00234BC6D5|nr:acyltransferase family protein [Zeaxanthinibacter sp. PT1]MDC6350830.1 acyltransferase family protein [Zeaxanthinibacter sp. PT1]